MTTRTAAGPAAQTGAIFGRLSRLDRFLPLWIFLAMGVGVLLGKAVPDIQDTFDSLQIGTVSLPIAVGLLWMMYPVLAKVKYEELGKLRGQGRLFGASILQNWLIGPALMTALAWLFLSDMPEYRTGLVIVGLARCIAMVLIWNMLAGGNSEDCAVLVALNSVFQIVMYSPLAYFYLTVVPRLFGADTAEVGVTMGDIAKSVLIFLGIPLAAGVITRFTLIHRRGREWYDGEFAPHLGRTAIIGLLFTVVVMFSMQGEKIVDQPVDVLRITIPLLVYFGLMFALSFFLSQRLGFKYDESATLSFTAASNNFELAIAVAVGSFGIASKQALATVVGPLVEVPVLIGLVSVALWLGRKFYRGDPTVPGALAGASVRSE
jgi:ACR3 family arsenite transporter